LSTRLYELFGPRAKLLGDREQIGLVRFQEADDGCEQPRLGSAPPELICPDTGQVEEALRPPLVGERCSKRGKAKRQRIAGYRSVWCLRQHSLEQPQAGL
jgi:hypothetical protein